MNLTFFATDLYRVKRGQSLFEIALAFRLTPRIIAEYNDLKGEPKEGEILSIPNVCGNLYTVRGGESMALLCGSKENFISKNKTKYLYPGQIILI